MDNLTYTSQKEEGLSGTALKYMALVTMFIDHAGLVVVWYGLLQGPTAFAAAHHDQLLSLYRMMRTIGRLAFPFYLFLLVQGFMYTHDRFAYGKRLFIFAVLSEIPFNLAIGQSLFTFADQNVMWTLLLGFLMLCLLEKIRLKDFSREILVLLSLSSVAFFGIVAVLFHTDYSYKGILILAALYLYRFDKKRACLLGALLFFIEPIRALRYLLSPGSVASPFWEPAAALSFIPICLYNKKRGKGPKYLFYFFYPVHLICLYLVEQLLLAL